MYIHSYKDMSNNFTNEKLLDISLYIYIYIYMYVYIFFIHNFFLFIPLFSCVTLFWFDSFFCIQIY